MSDSQTSFATLGSPIGTITQVTGSVVVKSIDGNERVVQVGDPIFFGETVETGSGGSATIKFIDGSEVVIGGDSNVLLNDEVYTPDDVDGLAQDSTTDTEALQQAIADGADPTLIQDAPAAGEEIVSQQQRVDVDVTRNQAGALPSYGFDTDGQSSLPSYGYDTNNSFSALSSNARTSSTTNSTADNSADIDNNLTVIVSQSDRTANATEARSVSVSLSGVDSDASQVSVVFSDGSNSVTANATQNGAGNWVVADTDISSLNDGTVSVTTTVTDSTGNTATATDTLDLDTTADAGVVTVNAITEDDVINAAESVSTISVSGTAIGGDVAVGDIVTMKINGTDYSTTIDDVAGNWTVDVAGSDLAEDTAFSVDVVSSDAAGNIITSTGISTHTVDTKAFGQIDIDRITSDSIVNSEESADGNLVSITGSVGNDARPGDSITVTVGGVEVGQGVVSSEQNDDGKYLYSVEVLGSDLANTTLVNPEVVVTVTGEDDAGNPFSANNTEFYKVDQFADSDIFLSEKSGDNVVNLDESGNLTVGGWLEEGGNVTSITITDSEGESVTYTGSVATSDEDGFAYFEKSIDVSSLADGDLSVVVGVVDAVGNTGFSEAEVINKDTSADAGTVTVNAITSDDVINAAESDATITVTGKASGGDIAEGDSVTMTINGQPYSTTVDADGNWTVDVAGSDLAADTAFDVDVASSDAAGNTVKSTGSSEHTVDTSADAGTVTVNAITSDDVINAAESDATITVTGKASGGDIAEGDSVTMTINGQPYSTTVDADGNWTVDVAGSDLAADTAFDVDVASSDAAGNTVKSTGSSEHTVDTSVSDLTSDITDGTNSGSNDDTITSDATPEISGVTEAGAIVTISYTDATGAAQTATGTADEDGNYTIAIENALAEGSNSLSITAVDAAGNESTITQDVTVDTSVSDLTSDITDGTNSGSNDDTITSDATPEISGVTEAGAIVTISYTDATGAAQTATGTADEDGNYTIAIENALAEGSNSLSITAVDAAGNESTITQDVTVDTSVSDLTSDITDGTNSGSNDDTITSDATPEISGVTEAGAIVTISYTDATGAAQTATGTADEDGNYTIAIENALAEGSNSLSITAVDAAGNESTITQDVTVDTSVSDLTSDITDGTNSGSNDDTITSDATPEISGVTEAGAIVTISYTDATGAAQTATGTADEDGNYTIAIENALAEGSNSLSITAVDAAGNESTITQDVTVDTSVSDLTSDITDGTNSGSNDDTITSDATPEISGVTEAGAIVTISYTDATGAAQTATGTADEDGNYTIAIENALAEGSNSLSITAVDAAGNESTITQDVTVDTSVSDLTSDITDGTNSGSNDDTITSDATPEISGVTEAGAIVTISYTDATGAAQTATGTADEDGNYTIAIENALAEGSNSLSITAVDAAGNESTITQDVTVDTSVSDLTSDITDGTNSGSNDDTITSDATPEISGVTEAGAIVTISYTDATGAAQTATGTADEDGNYTIAIENALAEGSNSLSITAVDAAGNESTITQDVTVDTSVSDLTSDITDGTNSGSNDDTITSDATPEISGVTEAGAIVTISYTDATGAAQTATGTADEDGNYTIAIENALAEGSNSLSITAVDAAGNESTITQDVTVDTSVSDLTSDITDGTNSGSNDDTITSDATPEISGVTEAGAIVTISYTDATGAAQTATGTADEDGNYTIAIENALAEGSNSLSITAVDAAGNESTITQDVTVDTSVSDLTSDITDGTNSGSNDDTITSDATPEISGVTEAGAIVTISYTDATGAAQTATGTADEDGNYTIAIENALAEGSNSLSITAVDAAGNESTITQDVTVDTSVSDLTSDITDGTNSGSNDDTITSDATPEISGVTEAGAIVTISYTDATGAAQTATGTADEDGNYTIAIENALAEGSNSLSITAVDAAGNESTITQDVTVDTSVSDLTSDITDGTNSGSNDDTITSDATPEISGVTEAGAIVTISYTDATGAAQTATGTADEDGNYTIAIENALAEGSNSLSITAVDAAGNESTITQDVTVDTSVSDLTSDITDGTNSGSNDDTITSDATPEISGVTEAGAIVTISYTDATGAAQTATGTADEDGNYTIAIENALAEGSNSLSITAVDAAGNESTITQDVTVDTSVSDLTSDITDGTNSGSNDDTITSDATPEISGVTEAGAIVTISYTDATGAAQTATGTADEDGNYTIAIENALAEGSNSLSITAVDAAGNESTITQDVTVDTSVSDLTSDITDGTNSGSNDDTITSDATPEISGVTEAGAIVTISYTDATGAAQTATGTADEDGNYTIAIENALAEGSNSLSITAVDAAGNESTITQDVTVDTTAAGAPGVTITEDANNDGLISAAELDGDVNVTISLTGTNAVEGDTLTVNGTDIELTAAQITAGEVLTTVAAPEEGDTLTVSATITDAAGNISAAGTDSGTVDTIAAGGTVTVDDITGDDVINVSESKGTITVTGTAVGGDIAEGDTVTMTINGSDYDTTVKVDGTWSVEVAGGDLAADTAFDVVVASSDAAGNTVDSTGSSTHTLDQSALLINLDIDQVTNDGVLNSVEVAETVTVTGQVTGDDFETGTVTLLINNATYTTTVGSDGAWSVDVAGSDLQADSDKQIEGSVSVANSIGQQGEADTTETYLVDTSARATVHVNSITSDDVLNAEESSSTVTVSGRVGFDAAAGDVVSMTINGQDYSAVVLANKTWSVDVDGSDLAADTSFTVTVTGEDNAGNPFTGSTTSSHTVDMSVSAPTISIAGDANEDGVYNAAELGTDGTVTATISIPTDAVAGDTVTYQVGDADAVEVELTDALISSGITVEIEPEATIKATITDVAGNRSAEATATADDADITATAPPVITNITDDSANSDYSTVTLHGTGEPGTSITLHVISGSSGNGNNTQTGEYVEVEGLSIIVDENGNWTADVSNLTDVQANDNEFFKATQTDAAGNVSDDSNTAQYWHGSATSVSTEVGDDYVLSGSGNDQITMTGKGVHDTNGQLTIDGGAGTDTVIFSKFALDKASFVLNDDGSLQITRGDTNDIVLLIDVENVKIDGNTYTISELFTPTVAITNDTNNDGLLNSGEADGSVTVSIDLPIGAKVGDQITIATNNGENDRVITLTPNHLSNGSVSVSVSGIAVTEGETLEVSASLSTGGGVGSDSALVDTSVSGLTADITDATNSGSNDDSITNNATPTITGQTEAGATVTITYTDASGVEQTTDAVTADTDGNYSITIPAALVEGSNDLTVKAVDVAGNETTITQNVTVDTSVSGLTADITDATNSGSNADTITNNATPTIAGQTEAGATVTILYLDATGTQQTATGTADENGTYSITLDDGLPEGTNSLNIKAIDAAGNETKIMHDVTIDTSVASPTISIAGDVNKDGVYNAEELGEDGTVTATISIPTDAVAGDTVTYQVGDADAVEVELTDTLISSGITVEIEPEATIKATITDAAGNTSTEATVKAFASVLADTAVTDEDTSVSGNILTNDSDVNNSLVVVSVTVSGIDSTYAVDNDGTDTLIAITQDVTATDNNGNESTSTVTVGALVLSADGSYTFTPTGDWNGTVPTITYTTNTGATSTLDITVDAINDAPVLSVTESVTVTVDDVTAGESSVSGNGYTLTGYSHYLGINDDGTVNGNLTALSTIDTGTNHDGIGVSANTTTGSDEISEIGSTDENAEAIVVTFDDAVTSVDASFGWLDTMETATYTFYSNGVEVGSSTFTDGTNTTDSAGTLSITDEYGNTVAFDTIVFTATYTGDDGTDDSDYLLSSLMFDNLVTTDTLTAIEGGEIISGTVSATDVDNGSVLTYSLVDSEGAPAEAPAGLTVDFDNGTWSFDPKDTEYDSLPIGETATVEAIVQVTDEHGAADTQAITITVTGMNDGPVATDDKATVDEDGGVITIDVLSNDTDLDGDTLTITGATVPEAQGTVAIVDGKLEFTPAENFNGDASISYTVSDGTATDTADVKVTVAAVNDAPVATDDSTMVYSTGIRLDELPEYGTMEVKNADGDWVEMTAGVTYPSDTEVRFDPEVDKLEEAVDFEIGSFDADSDSKTGSFDGTASVSDWGSLNSDGKVVKTFNDGTPDGAPEITVTTSVSTGTLTAWNGKNSVGYGIGNETGNGLSLGESLIVDIDATDVSINKISFTLAGLGGYFDKGSNNETAVSITAHFVDGSEQSISSFRIGGEYESTYSFTTNNAVDYFVLTTTGSNGSYVVQNMTISQVVPDTVTLTTLQADGSETTTSVTFDPSDVSEDGTVSLTSRFADLLDGNLTEGVIATDEDASITIDVLANDTDVDGTIDPTTVVITTQPEHGTVSVNSETGEVTYTPNDNYNGEDSFEYTVKDNNGLVSNLATVSLTVNSVDDAPVITLNDESVTVSEKGLEDSTTGITSSTGTFTVSDADGDDLSVSLAAPTETYTSGGVALVWVLSDSGDLIGSVNGEAIVTVTLGDVNSSGEGSYTVTLSGPVDQPNTAADDSLSIQFGVAVNDGSLTTTSTITAVIKDDAPTSVTTEAELQLSASTFSVSNIASGFSSAEFDESTLEYIRGGRVGMNNEVNTDEDTYKETLSWGNGAFSLYQSYSSAGESSVTASEVEDNSSDIGFGDSIVVAKITHDNGLTNASYADSLTSANFNVDVTLVIDGTEVTVKLSSLLSEDDTSNILTNSGDILTLASSSTEVVVNDVSYTVSLDGFLVDGEVVNSVTTAEYNQWSDSGTDLSHKETYSVVAHVELTDSSSAEEYVLTGTLNTDAGADGLDSVVASNTSDDNGAVTINADGTYSFTPSDALVSALGDAGSQVVQYSYSVVDGDGDSVENTLSITVSGPNYGNTAPQAVDDSSSNVSTVSGLNANFYNYDQDLSGNLTDIASARAVIATQSANASWIATEINYQEESNDLGGEGNLATWIGDDAESLVYYDEQYSGDAVVELTGSVYLEAGSYSIKVEADDGYEIVINGEVVASIDHNQSSTTKTSEFDVSESGNQTIEIVYWDQGEAYELNISLAESGTDNYEMLGSDAYPTFSSPSEGFLDTSSNQALEISLDDLLANDIDVDGDELSVTSISNVVNGYAYLNSDGGITFIPTSGYSGTATFDYTITDGNGGHSTATASIDVVDTTTLPTVTVSISEPSTSSQLWTGFSTSSDADEHFRNYDSYEEFDSSDHNIYIGGSVSASLELGSGNDNIHIKNDVQSGGYIALGDGNNNLIVEGSVSHSISAGSGDDQIQLGKDLSASINLGGGDNYLSIAANVNTGAAINMGSGNDEVHIGGSVKSSVELGEGNNKVIIGGDLYAEIGVGSGDDQIQIGGDVSGYIGLGQGDNTLIINGDVSAGIDGGSGDDLIRIDGDVNNYIGLGEGDNVLVIGGDLNANIGMGTGSDFIVLVGLKGADVYFDGGTTGTDSIVLSSYSSTDYTQNKDNIQTKIVGFENVLFSDGIIQGNVTAFADYIANDGIDISLDESGSGFLYDVTVDIDNTDAAADSSIVSLFGIPTTASLVLDGETLEANTDGSYSIGVATGETSIENLSIQSDIELPDLDITSEVTTNLDDVADVVNDSYLEGTDGIDTLFGDLGDDVLFGGDDEVTDVLTGADGSDIFILNQVEDQNNIDTIVDFNASEDSLDLTDLLTGIEGSPDENASVDAITEFLEAHVTVEDGAVKVDDKDVANFTEETSSFDSNGDSAVNSTDSVTVVYNNEEYSINIDG